MEKQNTPSRMFNLLVVDMSGSMYVIRQQAFAGLNETLTTVQAMQQAHPEMEQRVTLLTFNSNRTSFVYDNAAASDIRQLPAEAYQPAAATPLYDAIGRGIARISAQCKADDHVLVTIITDGEENCSREYNLTMVRNLIDKLKTQNWTFTFIGTDNLDVEGMSAGLGITNHLSFKQDAACTNAMFEADRDARVRYCKRAVKCDDMTDYNYFENDSVEEK